MPVSSHISCLLILHNFIAIVHQQKHQVFTHLQAFAAHSGSAALSYLRLLQPVNHHFNIMDLIAVYLHFGSKVYHFAINPHFQESPFPDVFKQLAVMTFSPSYQRRKQSDFFIFKLSKMFSTISSSLNFTIFFPVL